MIENQGVAVTHKTAFHMECSITVTIRASQEKIWAILTSAGDYPKWNSTVIGIDGKIGLRERIRIKSTLDTSRSFKLRVSEFSPPVRMVWSDGMKPFFRGLRTFTLTLRADGSTEVIRTDHFSGLLFPLISGSLPDFGPSFESFGAELKLEAEKD